MNKKFLSDTHPEIAEQWHPTKNLPLTIKDITPASRKIVWWKCDKNHEWENSAFLRNGRGCPICANREVLIGYNDLNTTHPEIAAQWHPTKNGDLKPENVVSGTHKKAWWKCDKNHEWETKIVGRTSGKRGCPICSNKITKPGINDLATTHPSLAKQWHPTKNGELLPTELNPGSHKKVWWLGECGHEWQTSLSKRTTNNTKCPVCDGKKILPGFNDLKSKAPELASEWHPTKNINITPETIHFNSEKIIWWLGKCGHEWQSSVYNRNKLKTKCLVCNNKNTVTGFNDLTTILPGIPKQWHPTKNGTKNTPSQITSGSDIKAWWLCEKGHEWNTYVYSRKNHNCPKCSVTLSSKEKEIFIYLKNKLNKVEENNRNIIPPYELDIYIPDKNIAIEYNGLYWHSEKYKTRTYHYDKWLACKDKGIQLIQIWEDDYLRNPELVKNMLSHKLGLNEQNKIYARQTILKNTYSKQAEEFLRKNHIQGYASGSYYLGLFDKKDIEKLVAVLVVKKEPGTNGKTLNIIRYATSMNVVGGFTKLLKHVEKTYKPERIITFSDHCVSDGGLYENNGFIADKELAPDYMYVVGNTRKHKFGYRLKRFQNDSNLKYEPGFTERELAALNGLHRVWDAGKTRWVKET